MPLSRPQSQCHSLQAITLEYIQKLGLQVPDRPIDEFGSPLCPKLPADITKLTIDELGRLYGQFVAIAQYASAQLGLADIDHIEYDYEADQTEAREGLSAEGNNKEERKYNTQLHPTVVRRRQEAFERKAKKTLLITLVDGYKESAKCLSRELSRRGVDFD